MQKEFSFDSLMDSDLYIDAIYKGGNNGNAGDDPISKILRCGNQGGFRYRGNSDSLDMSYIILYSSSNDPDWPDYIDFRTGLFTYYGDNKRPGHELHDTPRKGNLILKASFELLEKGNRKLIPPYFIFTKRGVGRDVIFRGLAVPGAPGLQVSDNLVAVWKSQKGNRFQNYKASFTILECELISRKWLNDLDNGIKESINAPEQYIEWIGKGHYSPLIAERSMEYRSKSEQLPVTEYDKKIIYEIYNFFDNPYSFEKCAAELVKLMDRNVTSIDLTRPYIDGGRDGIGKYRIGTKDNSIDVEFAIEAKRYDYNNCVGVKEVSRLISRIRHRQFGVLVTTSYVHLQAYKEIIEDRHPIVIVSAKDIVYILKQAGISSLNHVKTWLSSIGNNEG